MNRKANDAMQEYLIVHRALADIDAKPEDRVSAENIVYRMIKAGYRA